MKISFKSFFCSVPPSLLIDHPLNGGTTVTHVHKDTRLPLSVLPRVEGICEAGGFTDPGEFRSQVNEVRAAPVKVKPERERARDQGGESEVVDEMRSWDWLPGK